jgi:hypothetical protein
LSGLARYLDRVSDLGSRPFNFLPGLTGVEAITARYLSSLAVYYLKSLPHLASGDDDLLERLSGELEVLALNNATTQTCQIAVAGIIPTESCAYRDVALRARESSDPQSSRIRLAEFIGVGGYGIGE